MPRPDPSPALTAEDIDALWANAAHPEDYASLRFHRVTQEGEPAGLPPEIVEQARQAAEVLGGRRRRRRRGKKKSGNNSERSNRRPSSRPSLEWIEDTIHDLMEALDVPDEAYEFHRNTVVFPVPEDEMAGLPPLPEGYGYKGGVVRKALARTLRLPISTAAVRDIDLLKAADTPPDHDRELAERYMTDDLIHGDAKVEAVINHRDYFTTREVTVNEAWLLHDEIEITHLGLIDTLAGVVRITQGHLNQNFGRAHPIVAFKVLRFAASMQAEGREPVIPPFRVNFRRRPHPFAFFLALQLSRALEGGVEVAEHFLEYARQWNLLAKADLPDDVNAKAAAEVLSERLSDYHLDFEFDTADE
ncbi:MAG: hypothetical protein AAGH99_15630 [Planctomycetota bacterium]